MNRLKKPFPLVIPVLIGVIIGALISSTIFAVTGLSVFGRAPKRIDAPVVANDADLTAVALDVVGYIGSNDFGSLASVVHPDYGVVFSPYATVTLSTNKRFSAEQIALFGTDSTVYVWGVYDGSGEPIEMTPAAYFSEFVFSRNYCEAPVIGVNRIIKSGNALENITEMFPGVKFVDFHIPGCDMDLLGELDWSSLRLGFEEEDGRLWLTVILNSRWTV